jgi:hypothetical protein
MVNVKYDLMYLNYLIAWHRRNGGALEGKFRYFKKELRRKGRCPQVLRVSKKRRKKIHGNIQA